MRISSPCSLIAPHRQVQDSRKFEKTTKGSLPGFPPCYPISAGRHQPDVTIAGGGPNPALAQSPDYWIRFADYVCQTPTRAAILRLCKGAHSYHRSWTRPWSAWYLSSSLCSEGSCGRSCHGAPREEAPCAGVAGNLVSDHTRSSYGADYEARRRLSTTDEREGEDVLWLLSARHARESLEHQISLSVERHGDLWKSGFDLKIYTVIAITQIWQAGAMRSDSRMLC